jgi:hypothetical protein
VIDQGREQGNCEHIQNKHKINYIGQGVGDALYVEDPKLVARQLIVLSSQEEPFQHGTYILPNSSHQRQIHSHIKDAYSHPCELLDQAIVKQLDIKYTRVNLATMTSHIIKSEPTTINPSSPLPQKLG